MQNLEGTVFEASWARRLGLFSGRPVEELSTAWPDFVVSSDGKKIITFTIPLDPILSLEYPTHEKKAWLDNKVEFTQVQMKFGPRWYFICPITQKKCLKLIFYRGVAGSREGIKLLPQKKRLSDRLIGDLIARERLDGRTGKQRLTAREREKLLTRLARLTLKDPQVEILVDRDIAKTMRQRLKRVWESLPLSTTQAFHRLQGVSMGAFRMMELRSQNWFENVPPITEYPEASETLCITAAGELDIRILLDREVLNVDELTALVFGWPPAMIDGHSVSMYVRPKASGFPQLIMEIQRGDETPYYQNIELFGRGPSVKPRYFICPVHRMRCDVLYFRFGYFASREAQNLKFPVGGKRMHALKLFRGLSPAS